MRLPKLLICLIAIVLYGCYNCEEVSDFHLSSIQLTLFSAETEVNYFVSPNEGGFWPDILMFRDGEIDSTEIKYKSGIRIDDWDIINLIRSDGRLNVDTTFEIIYLIHFLKDTIDTNQINIDTLNVRYSVMDTECDVLKINELLLLYNGKIIYDGQETFSVAARI